MAHFVQFNDVTKTYRMGETSVDALSGMSFEIDEGELVVILGPSGAGKQHCSTCLAEWTL